MLGPAVSANKGAASMFFGLLDGLSDRLDDVHVDLFTTYPDEDRSILQTVDIPAGLSVRVTSATPVSLLIAFLLALPIRTLDRLGVPIGPLAAHPLIRRVRNVDVVVDLAGISFADGRGIALLGYNVVMSLFPYLAGAKVVKGSQAIGPTKAPLTRAAAWAVLPRMTSICARGKVTRSQLDQLGLDNVVDAADIAFLMHHSRSVDDHESGDGRRIVFMPSAVVDGYARSQSIDHVGVLAEVFEGFAETGYEILILPHSFRTGGGRGRMNDGPVVDDLEHRVVSGAATFRNEDLGPRELRSITEWADVVVTGRFHGMVSSLEVGTVPVVIGWSHKYGEVLDQFGVGDQAIAVGDLSSDSLRRKISGTLNDLDALQVSVRDAHDGVVASAQRNIDVIVEIANPSPT